MAQNTSSHVRCWTEFFSPLRPADQAVKTPLWRGSLPVITASVLLVTEDKRETLPAGTGETVEREPMSI